MAGAAIAAEDRIRGPIEISELRSFAGQHSSERRGSQPINGGDVDPRHPDQRHESGSGAIRSAARRARTVSRSNSAILSSPDYQNWLTPEQYGERFGLSENDLATISSWLQSHGFAIEQVARARNWITFNGTAGQIARAFRTELHHVEVDGEAHFANTTEAWIPASLAGIVGSIRGLDDFRPKPQRAKLTLASRVQCFERRPITSAPAIWRRSMTFRRSITPGSTEPGKNW